MRAIQNGKVPSLFVVTVDGVATTLPHSGKKPSEKEYVMYAAIRRLKVQSGVFDEVVQLDESGLVPLLSGVPGSVEFDLVHVGEDVGVTISIFEMQQQAEEANRRAADWVKQNRAPLVAGPPEIVVVGEIERSFSHASRSK